MYVHVNRETDKTSENNNWTEAKLHASIFVYTELKADAFHRPFLFFSFVFAANAPLIQLHELLLVLGNSQAREGSRCLNNRWEQQWEYRIVK